MASVSRQIGWSQESNLLYQILKQITRLTSVIFGLKPKYKVFTALVSQSGESEELLLNSGAVTKGVTYKIDGANDGDFSNVGAFSNESSTYFIATNNEVPNSYGSAQLIYNPGAPVTVILENTIGNVWFIYETPGIYSLNSDSLFIEGKTFMDNAGLEAYNVFNRIINDSIFGGTQKGYYFIKQGESIINLKTLEDPETPADSIIGNPICMEFKVYN